MIKRLALLLLVLGLATSLAGCDLLKGKSPILPPLPTVAPQVVTKAVATSAPTTAPTQPLVAPTVVLSPTQALPPTLAPTKPVEAAGKNAPLLVAPPDGVTGRVLDLVWQWDKDLLPEASFEVQVWKDLPGGTPLPFGWTRDITQTVTAANLLPGPYRWRVAVVRGQGQTRAEELSDWSEERTFTMTWPSTLATAPAFPSPQPTIAVSPTATRTRTPTRVVVWPTAVVRTRTPTATRTATVVPATATATVVPPVATATSQYPLATNTPIMPVPTATSGYPVATNTPGSPAPTATSAYPAATNTPVPPAPTATSPATVAPTNTPLTKTG
jgi:hypothetical protein